MNSKSNHAPELKRADTNEEPTNRIKEDLA